VKKERLKHILCVVAYCCAFIIPIAGLCEASDKTVLKVRGATTVSSLISNWAKDFENGHSDTSVVLYGSTHGDGLRALLDREADIMMAARKLSESELLQAKNKNLDLKEAFLENDAVAIVVNADNPVNELSMDQLTRIFNGEYSNWKEVGGKDEAIIFLTLPPDSGMRSFLSKDVIKVPFTTKSIEEKSITRLLSMVRPRPGAITYCRTELALDGEATGNLKCLAIKKNSESPAIKLSEESVINGTFPISRALCLYYDGNNSLSEEFSKFCVQKAQEKTRTSSAALAIKNK